MYGHMNIYCYLCFFTRGNRKSNKRAINIIPFCANGHITLNALTDMASDSLNILTGVLLSSRYMIDSRMCGASAKNGHFVLIGTR